MRVAFDEFIISRVKTAVNHQTGDVATYIEGLEIGGFIVSGRVIGKALETELKDLVGSPIRGEFLGVDFLDRDRSVLALRASDFKVLDVLHSCAK